MDKSKSRLECSICNNPIPNQKTSFNLTWVKATGVDGDRKSSHYWNYNNDTFICPICNLIYSCIPAGFTIINKKGYYINKNQNLAELHNMNKYQLFKGVDIEELEEQSYYNVIDNMKHSELGNKEYEIQNIQVVKYDGENSNRPYTFNILSTNLLSIIKNNEKNLKQLLGRNVQLSTKVWINLHQEVLKRLYNNENMFSLINMLIKDKVNPYYISRILSINNDFIGGMNQLITKEELNKKVDLSRYFGELLRQEYIRIGNPKKIEGISYRLLNALKTKNAAKFTDVLINSYMYVGKEIPFVFVDVLKDKDLLQSYGYGFLLGLQGQNNKRKEDVNNEG